MTNEKTAIEKQSNDADMTCLSARVSIDDIKQFLYNL